MIISLSALILLCFIIVWIFLKSSPSIQGQQRALLNFNLSSVFVAVFPCVLLTYFTYISLVDTVDRAWWPVLSGLGSVLIISVVLLGGVILRMIVFRERTS